MVRRPWMDPCETWRAPRCRSRPSSRRRNRRWGEVASPARPLRCGLCSCTGLRHAAGPGTSRCPHGAAWKRHRNIMSEQKTYIQRTSD
jgi:hypothetical protein